MKKVLCPSCGGELQFKSRVSVFGVCSYCATTVVRHDLNVEEFGKMAQLPPDMSPLQVGTKGSYGTLGFEILGRLKIDWEDGTWNEWYCLFSDARDGWLAEAQGEYMISFQVRDGKALPSLRDLSPGTTVSVAGKPMSVKDMKDVTCVGSEGELPMKAPAGRRSTSVDLSNETGEFATLDYGPEEPRLYAGKYVTFDSMKLQNLREVDGW